jgi:hypothetical protein
MIRLMLVCVLLLAGCRQSVDESQSTTPNPEAIERITKKGPVQLIVRVSPLQPRLSDLIEMDVVVTAQPDVEINPPTFGDAVGDFLVRDYSERSPQEATNDVTNMRVFHYQLEPVASGTHLIRSVAVEFVDNRESSEEKGKASLIESEPIEIKITTELGEQTPDLTNLDPMLPPVPIDRSVSYWLIAGLMLAIAMAVAVLLRRRWKQPPSGVQVRQQTPEEIAQEALAQLLRENLPSAGLFKEFYVRLTGVVRCYIEGTTGLKAPEQTTEEFLREMRSKEVFSAERSMRLKEFLEAADMVKYAGQQPGAEQIELSILRTREFVFKKQ